MLFNYTTIIIFLSLLYSVFTDLTKGKIKNIIIIIIFLSGIIYFLTSSKHSLGFDNIIGLIIPFILLIYFFKRNYIGGGDIKLFMSLGFIYGLNCILLIMFLTFFIALLFYIIKRLFSVNISNRIHLSFFIFVAVGIYYLYLICWGRNV